MKKIYLDWNIINHLEEDPELYDYIRQNQSHFVFVYSPAHFSDFMKSYTEDGSNKYFEKDLEILETVCETHLIRYCDKKIDIHRCLPREFLEKEGKDYPVSKHLLHFDELKESLKIGNLDFYDIFCESLKTIRLDKKVEIPLIGSFSNAYELLNLSLEFFKKLLTDKKHVKNVRVGGTNDIRDEETPNINNYNPKEVVAEINSFLSSHGADFDIEELIKKNINPEHHGDEKILFEGLYVSLDLMNYHPDKRDLMNILTDADHAFYGGYCDVLVTGDAKMRYKTEAVYSYLGIDTKVLEKKELLQYLNNEIKKEKELDASVEELFSNQRIPEEYDDDSVYRCIRLEHPFFSFFNKLEYQFELSSKKEYFVFYRELGFEKCVYYTETEKFFQIIRSTLRNPDVIASFDKQFVERYKKKDSTARFICHITPTILLALGVEEVKDFFQPIMVMSFIAEQKD